ncbi:MAG: sigma-70 family RNA polymerase sigma factor, partial [Oscillospiraceae bacterium]|nr:sigma-70 family RNA polymerase sigma factor [Oscillospiraceae bacterium]
EKDERARTVVQMRLELFSYSEIAERLGISENSARVIEFRTRKWLKEILVREGLLE